VNTRPATIVALAIGVVLRIASLPVSGTPDVDAWKTWSYHAAGPL